MVHEEVHLPRVEVTDRRRVRVEDRAKRVLQLVHEDHVLAEQDPAGRENRCDRAVGHRHGAAAEAVHGVAGCRADEPREDADVVLGHDHDAGPDEPAAECGEHRRCERTDA